MKNNKNSILLVEDDSNLSSVLKDYLEMMDYETVLAKDGKEGSDYFKKGNFDLCILDVMMPQKDGFALAKEIRSKDEYIPIIFLTAKSMKEDRIEGFKSGCDDYITKPFSSEELSLRIQAILKRCEIEESNIQQPRQQIHRIGKYVFDPNNLTLSDKKDTRTLTKKEAALLNLLSENKNQLVSREHALKSIWGDDDYFIGRSMDVFITKLRKYLKNDDNVKITNVHGAGFKLEISK
ncbi:MAG: response regulator transcription factor [Bacteroidales bacterium]|nr:response regulator transcription factor [Bacteroidales bacterium]MCF8333933.1 response regulator transcription factor [Bacteroidales bacterium]